MDYAIIIKLFIFFLILDGFWLGLIARDMFTNTIQSVTNQSQPSVRLYSALIAYILMVVGAYYFVIPLVDRNNLLRDSIMIGGMFGLVVYGIYDATNHAIFPGWNLTTAIADMLWGAFLYSAVTYLTLRVEVPKIL